MALKIQIKGVAFDLDGVILSDAPILHYNAFNNSLKEFGYPIIPPDIHHKDYNGMGTKEKLRKWLPSSVSDSEIREINAAKQKKTEELIKETVRPDYETTYLLKFLRSNGYKLALVTNCLRPTAELIIANMELTPLFNAFISASDVINKKPDKEPYLKGATGLNLSPSEVLAVDDTELGCTSSLAAGCPTWELLNPRHLRLSRFWEVLKQLEHTNHVRL